MSVSLQKVQQDKPVGAVWLVPHLPGEAWFQKLEQSPALWSAVPRRAGSLVDSRGCAVGDLCVDLWLVWAASMPV